MQSDLTETVALLREMHAAKPYIRPRWLRAVSDAADALARLQKAAKPDCPDCHGSGLYGRSCICLCVNVKHQDSP